MAHAASQLKKKADENLAAEEEKEKEKKKARKRSREVKKKVEKTRSLGGEAEESSFVTVQPHRQSYRHNTHRDDGGSQGEY